MDFLARLNALVEQSTRLGDIVTDEVRMLMVTTRLREPWRGMAVEKMERDGRLTYLTLCQYLMLRQRAEPNKRKATTAYLGQTDNNTFGSNGGRTPRNRGGRNG